MPPFRRPRTLAADALCLALAACVDPHGGKPPDDTPPADTAAHPDETGTPPDDTGPDDTAPPDTAPADTGDTAETRLPPNILLIVADDLGVDKVGAWAGDYPGYAESAPNLPSTPRIDALAASGLRFSQAWANPTCSPTRAGLLTGRHAFRTGVGAIVPISAGLTPGEATVAEALHDAGWTTGLFGKWHLGATGVHGTTGWMLAPDAAPMEIADGAAPLAFGFDVYDGNLTGRVEAYHHWTRVRSSSPDASTVAWESGYAPDVTTDAALDFIKEQTGPWFVMVAYNAPHTDGDDHTYELDDVDDTCPSPPTSDDPVAIYAALVACLDDRVGRLLDTIPADQMDHTIVVFVGDNGTEWPMIEGEFIPDDGRPYGKTTPFETGVHVPLVLASGRRWLELEACAGASDCPTTDTRVRDPGRTVATPVGTIDLAATLSGLAGTTMPTAQDSTDLAPCLAGECGFDRALWTETYIEEDGALTEGAGAVRVGSDKLVALWEADGACEKDLLFDLQADPLETTDLADTDLDTRAALRDALATIGPTWLDGVPPCEEAAVTASGSPRSR